MRPCKRPNGTSDPADGKQSLFYVSDTLSYVAMKKNGSEWKMLKEVVIL
jgi:hypothetical protein